MTVPIHVIAKDGRKTAEQLLAFIEEHEIPGTLYAADFYIEGSESWEAVAGGWRHESGRIINVDHHAPHPTMQRHVSSATLALALLQSGESPGPDDAVLISHTDCDSVLSAGLLTGRLDPKPEYSDAAIAADHTGLEHEIADLLQGLDAHWSRARRSAASAETLDYRFECLERFEREGSLPGDWDGFAETAVAERQVSRQRAATLAQQRMRRHRDVTFARLEPEDGPIEGELFLPHLSDAWIVATTVPHADHADRWRWKLRLGLGAPDWLSLHDLGIEHFDPVFGGRWNAGSNNRPAGESRETMLPGSLLDPDDYHARVVNALDARKLERAIEIAVNVHRGQRDKAGAPYILHPLRVMAACSSIDAKIVGVLHDVVEDGEGWTADRLRAEGFGPDVLAGLDAVTKRPEEGSGRNLTDSANDERYFAFCRRAAQDPIGREVKRADLVDNMDVTRLPRVTEHDQKRLERYRVAMELLEAAGP